ncbi:MAG: GNAT family N-acetyltransferase [Nannocystaceae bacterium]
MKVHFIGIGGTGMGALALMLQKQGHEVRGADVNLYPPMSTQLESAEIEVFRGYGDANLEWGPDVVVVGNICSKDHPEVLAAQQRKIPLESFPSLLAKALLSERRSLVVAGTHGKTTTTSLLSWLLFHAGCDPSFLIGGVPGNFGRPFRNGAGEVFVVEGDEYDTAFFDKGSKFLHYRPARAILTSVEYDHADIFPDFDAMRRAFAAFLALIPATGQVVANAGDAEVMTLCQGLACEVVTYRVLPGFSSATQVPDQAGETTYLARVHRAKTAGAHGGRRTVFEVFENGVSIGDFSSMLVGHYNVGNTLAAIALARLEGVDVETIRQGVRRFRGVVRRQQLLGVAQGVRIISDFAHHPTSVDLTVRAMRRRYPQNRLLVCFEPRSASSRRRVFAEAYAGSFAAASRVFIGPLTAMSRIPAADRLDPKVLARQISGAGTPAHACETVETVAESVLRVAGPGDTVLVLSCGAFGGLAEMLMQGIGDAVRFASESDSEAVDRLCLEEGLAPIADVEQTDTLIIRGRGPQADVIVGCVSLQAAGDSALLFGLVVARHRRGEGLGWILVDSVVRWARTVGARGVYLVTENAADFFSAKTGFRPLGMTQMPRELRECTNFSNASTREDAICMVYDVPQE